MSAELLAVGAFLLWVIGIPISAGFMIGTGAPAALTFYGSILWPLMLLGYFGYWLAV